MELLELLKKKEGFVSGQEIADSLGISRNAVWKAVNRVRNEGYEIEAVPRRGYRIVNDKEAYGIASIQAHLHTKWLGRDRRIAFYKEIGSTNDEAKRRAEQGSPEGFIIVSDSQKSGKGRRGRYWQSPPGTAVYMTYLLRPDFQPDIAPMLTLIMALAAAVGIEAVTGLSAKIKWPNDIIINGKKAVGILTEMSAEPDFIHYVIIGTGVNVNMEAFSEEISGMATSLSLEAGKKISRSEIVGAITDTFEKYYEEFRQSQDLSAFIEEYNSRSVNNGNRVRVLDPLGEYEALALGINEKGQLIVETEDKERRVIYSGEVSVRGIYGYV